MKYWMYAPGDDACNFDNDKHDNVIGLGMDNIPDLSGMTAKAIAAEMRRRERDGQSYENIGAYAVRFRDMSVGDIVFAKRGLDKLIGVARVIGEYRPMPIREKGFIHTRKVDWLNGNVNSRRRFHFSRHAFYSIDEDDAEKLFEAAGISRDEFVDEGFDSQIQAEDRICSVKCRGGQAKYRAALMRKWHGRCAVTGIEELELLRASHLKPFWACSKDERYDTDNGLILAAHVDVPFDAGLITFDDGGEIEFSPWISTSTIAKLGLSGLHLPTLNSRQKKYLQWHRNNVFKR